MKVHKIIHIDCDCFYAAVEIRDNPTLAGRPVAVGGDPSRRGVIATCNYQARRYGVHSAMASSRARRLCPELIILKPDFEKYRAVSRQIHTIFRRYTEIIEPLSLDEAFLDVTDANAFGNRATQIAKAIRRDIASELGITVSAGVSTNKMLAKVASEWRKPDGLFVILPEHIPAFVRRLPVSKLHGVGRVTSHKMQQLGIQTCGDLQEFSEEQLNHWFGNFGSRLYQLARGQDDRPLRTERERKSISVEYTYEQDLHTLDECLTKLPTLERELAERFARIAGRYQIQGHVVKFRYHDFAIATCEHAAGGEASVFAELFHTQWERRDEPVRLLGVGYRIGPRRDTGEQLLLTLG